MLLHLFKLVGLLYVSLSLTLCLCFVIAWFCVHCVYLLRLCFALCLCFFSFNVISQRKQAMSGRGDQFYVIKCNDATPEPALQCNQMYCNVMLSNVMHAPAKKCKPTLQHDQTTKRCFSTTSTASCGWGGCSDCRKYAIKGFTQHNRLAHNINTDHLKTLKLVQPDRFCTALLISS